MSDTNTSRKFLPATMNIVAQRPRPPQRPWHSRWALISITAVLMLGGAIIWILSLDGIIQSTWAGLCGAVFTVLGAFLTLLQLIVQLTSAPAATSPAAALTQHHQAQRGGLSPGTTRHTGAIAVFVKKQLAGSTIHLSREFDTIHLNPIAAANVSERSMDGRPLLVGFFPALEPGPYTVYIHLQGYISNVTVHAGQVAEVDWRPVQPHGRA